MIFFNSVNYIKLKYCHISYDNSIWVGQDKEKEELKEKTKPIKKSSKRNFPSQYKSLPVNYEKDSPILYFIIYICHYIWSSARRKNGTNNFDVLSICVLDPEPIKNKTPSQIWLIYYLLSFNKL